MKRIALLITGLFLASCGADEEQLQSKQRRAQLESAAQKILQRGPIEEVFSSDKGELITLSIPTAGLIPSMVKIKTCRVWRDKLLSQSSLECEAEEDLLITVEKMQEFSNRQQK